MEAQKPGYHLREIPRGVLGETSKIREELDELDDAEEQGVRVMALVEAADIFGAFRAYLRKRDLSMEEVRAALGITSRRGFVGTMRWQLERLERNTEGDLLEASARFLAALSFYVEEFGMTSRDLERMADVTERAFLNGRR